MIIVMLHITILKIFEKLFTNNKPPCIPIPLLSRDSVKNDNNTQYIKIIVAILLKRIARSRLFVTELLINNNKVESNNINSRRS